MSRYCEFRANLNENLRDQFVCGIKSEVIRQRLFAENGILSFPEAVMLASSLEAAERDAAAVMVLSAEVTESPTTAEGKVHLLASHERAKKARGGLFVHGNSGSRTGHRVRSTGCGRCGSIDHGNVDCRYRDFVCGGCGIVGHLRRMCRFVAASKTRASVIPAVARSQGRTGIHHGQANQRENAEEQSDVEENLHQLCLNNYKAI
ncbi:uncharacterized protein LOC119189324 [Manduca sexta]|uniref:uncharacterized protein LOC119189324 n=1 Tax=Manduca sexta TaxID=7130 RepID=UPI00188E2F61|nr:uncharacterized protein LOC119189324 [Manduca sexta]